jgi:hypothetical protein
VAERRGSEEKNLNWKIYDEGKGRKKSLNGTTEETESKTTFLCL